MSAYYGINVSCEHEYGGDCDGDNNQNDQPGADIGAADTDDKVGEGETVTGDTVATDTTIPSDKKDDEETQNVQNKGCGSAMSVVSVIVIAAIGTIALKMKKEND